MLDPDETAPRAELTDEQLDIVLTAADHELLEHVRAYADRNATLITIMAEVTPVVRRYAARMIGARSDVGAVIRHLRLASNLIRARGSYLERACDLVRSVDLDPDADILDASATRLAGELAYALGLLHDLVRGPVHARDQALDHALDHALDLARELVRHLEQIRVEASGADLTKIRIEDLWVLDGVIWSDQTTWPPDIEDQVRSRSAVIKPGVYQVRGGNERDPSDLARA